MVAFDGRILAAVFSAPNGRARGPRAQQRRAGPRWYSGGPAFLLGNHVDLDFDEVAVDTLDGSADCLIQHTGR